MADVIAELVVRLGYEVDDKGLKRFDSGTEKATSKARKLSQGLRKGATQFAKYGAAAAAAGAVLVGKLIVGVASTADEVAKTSKQLGINAQGLQRLRFAAQRAGTSAGTLDKAVKKLNVGLVDAKIKGTGPLSEGLDILGIDLKQLENLNTEDRLKFLADALAGVEDKSLKSAIAAKLFGERAGPGLVPLLNEGAAGIDVLLNRADALGGVLGEDALKAGEDFQDAILDLKTAAFGAGAGLVQGLVPGVTSAVDGFTDWIGENDEFIKQDLPAILETIAEATFEVIKFFADALAHVDDFITEITQLAEIINEEYGPAIDFAIETGETLLGIWTDIAGAIGKGILELLGFLGVINDVEETIIKIKTGLGIETEKRAGTSGIAGLEGQQGEAARGRGRQAAEDRRRDDEAIKRAQDVAADAQRQGRAAQRARLKGLTLADVKGPPKKGGGGGGKGKAAELDPLLTAQIRGIGERVGATDKAIAAALQATSKSIGGGASEGIALNLGLSSLEKLTGADLGADKAGAPGSDGLAALFGGTGSRGSPAGRGASPTAGAKFVRIDASFNAPTTVTIQLPEGALEGMSNNEVLELVELKVGDVLEERNRRAFDFYKGAVAP